MREMGLLERARHAAGLSQEELARRGRTSRPTVSAYEHGRKSPTLTTVERLLAQTGHDLTISPRVEFVERTLSRGRSAQVPTRLPRLPLVQALGPVRLPLHLNWSEPGRTFELADRSDRARVYEIVLREGRREDVLAYIDGALLVDLWQELVLPRDVRAVWHPAVAAAVTEPAG